MLYFLKKALIFQELLARGVIYVTDITWVTLLTLIGKLVST